MNDKSIFGERLGRAMLAALMVAMAAVPGCFWFTSKGDGEQMKEELKALRAELAAEKDKAESDLKTIREQMKKVQEQAHLVESSLSGTLKDNLDDIGKDQEQLRKSIQRLTGQIEELQRKLDLLDADIRKGGLRPAGIDGGTAAHDQKDGGAPQKMAELKRPEKKKDFLKLGMNLLKNGQWEGARIIFGEYIEKFKGDPACAEAQFQIAESWFGEGKFQNSILEYQKVIEKYPKCNRVEEASYMLAVSFAQAGLPDEAKKLLEGFIAAYPDSKVAPRARKKLDEMKRAR